MKKIHILFALFLIYFSAFSQVPTITSFSPASGPVGTLVTITGTNLSSPTAFTIGGVSAILVSGSSDSLVGMVMPGAVTGSVSVMTSGGTASGSGNFTVTPTGFPKTQQGNKLVGNDAVGASAQGISVALSADDKTAIVGGLGDNNLIGAAWVYHRYGNSWIQQGSKLVGTGAAGTAEQGRSVALSADGTTAIVGGEEDDSLTGAAWIYTLTGNAWTQQGNKLVGTGAVGKAWQGTSVALSADGNTAIVGGQYDDSYMGAVWIYTRSGNTWTQQGSKLVGTGAVRVSYQGCAVALSADGNTALVGAYQDDSSIGAAWIYTRTGSSWTQQGSKLVGTGAVGVANQGVSVALSADGNTAIVGGLFDDNDTGAAWVFTRSGNTWTQQGIKLVGTGVVGRPEQGISVALSADGTTAIVGGLADGLYGAVWVFTRSGTLWTQQGNKLVGSGSVGQFCDQGRSAALSADGSIAIEGGISDNNTIGATWVFVSDTSAYCNSSISNIGQTICQGDTFTFGNQILTSQGSYNNILTNVYGCDSIMILNLSVNPVIAKHISDTINQSGSVTVGTHTYNQSGTYVDTLISATGCDSIVTLQLSVATGLTTISSNQTIHLYPNPNKGSFTLQTSNNIGSDYTISDMLGNVVAQQTIRSDSQAIELPEAAEGVYTLVVKGAQPLRFVIVR